MGYVPRRRDQDHLAVARKIQEMSYGSGGRGTIELGAIAAGELIKSARFVAIPPAQFRAGSNVFQPLVETRLALLHPARP
jgi:hypothetical protein